MSLMQIFRSLMSPDPDRPDPSEAVVIDEDLRSWLSPMDVADLEDYFSDLKDNDEPEWPVQLSATESAPTEDSA